VKRLFWFVAMLMICVGTIGTARAQTTMNWTVDGEKREAIVFAPAPTISNGGRILICLI
jgi:hypothetical protein